jgi:hypothetical protein
MTGVHRPANGPRRGWIVLAGAALVVSMGLPAAAPARAELRRSVVANGGGPAMAGGQLLQATAGQPAAGAGAAGSFRLCSGFWCFGGAATTAVEPSLPPGSSTVAFAFSPPLPNPAHGAVRFRLSLPGSAEVSLEVFDVAGRRVGEPRSQPLGAGQHDLWWSAPREQAGVYFARLRVEGEVRAERRFVLVR